MAVSFKIPKSPARSILTIDNFLGADFTNSSASVEESKSPNTVNMIRDVPGKVRKAMGYKTINQFGGKEEEFAENFQHIIENSMIGRPLSEIKIKSRQYLENDITPMPVVVEMRDYMGTDFKTYEIPLSAFENDGLNHLWASNGFYGFNDKADEIDFTSGKITKWIFSLDIQYLDDLLDVESEVYLKGQGYRGTVSFANDLYSWRIQKDNRSWEVDDAEDLSTFPIESGIVYYVCETSKEYSITLPSWATFSLFARETKISCEHLISFKTYVMDSDNLLRINGYHRMRGDEKGIIHAGTNIYRDGQLLYSEANDERSTSWQFEDKLYILDGKKFLVYYTETENDQTTYHVDKVEDNAYIPTLTISKDPSGGGTSYEDLNLLTPAFTETFLGQTGVKDYSLSFDGLDETPPKAYVMNSDGDFIEKTFGTDFTVNYSTGVITFTVAPGTSPLTGEDNVKITAYRTVEGYADRINKCSIGILYGVGGSQDRLFLSGNPDYANYDWFSEQFNPQYFADTSYSRLGSDKGTIIGYSIVNNYLATHKDDMDRDQNIIMRNGAMIDNTVAFRVVNSVQGAGALAKDSFAYLSTEPLFLTSQGVFAVTSQDVTGEKYVQNR